MPRRTPKGFTLLELMVTVAIAVIVGTVAVPSFLTLIASGKLSSQSNELVAAVMFARTEAIKQNENMVLCHSSDGNTCSEPPASGWVGWLVYGTVENVPLAVGVINSSKLSVLSSPNVAAAAMGGVTHSIRFSPQGLIRSGTTNNPLNGVIRVCMPTGALDNNIRDVELRSGGRAIVNVTGAGGSCPAPDDPA